MTRKLRKQMRKLKQDNQSKTQLNKLVWRLVDIISDQPRPNQGIENRLGYCPDCGQNYCFNFGNGVSWCRTCPIQTGCLKLHYPDDALLENDELIIRQCKPCRWKGADDGNRTDDLRNLQQAA